MPKNSRTPGIQIFSPEQVIEGIIALMTGGVFSLAIYQQFLTWPINSRRAQAFLMLATLAVGAGLLYLWRRWARKHFLADPTRFKISLLIGAVTALLFLIGWGEIKPQHHFLLPVETLTLEYPATNDDGQTVELIQFNSGTRDESMDSFSSSASWMRENDFLVGREPGHATWRGAVYKNARLVFATGPQAGTVIINWGGARQTLNLSAAENGIQVSAHTAPPPLVSQLLTFLLRFLPLGLLIGLFVWVITAARSAQIEMQPVNLVQRLAFGLPVFGVGIFMLLVYWPGILTADSAEQWQQITTTVFRDWHPVAHTLAMWLITRLWYSPAAIILVQVTVLSLVTGCGLAWAVEQGAPRSAAWLTALLLAFSPVSALINITLWKDAAYAIAMLGLWLQLFFIIRSRGAWLAQPRRWIWFGLTAAALALFRHNGWPVMLAVMALVFFVFRAQRKYLLLACVLWLSIYGLVRGPLYSGLKVERVSDQMKDLVLLHHIAAHVDHQTPLDEASQQYLNSLLPLEDWHYRCCWVNPVYFNESFDTELFTRNSALNRSIFIQTALKDPGVNIRHWLCASSLVWCINGPCQIYRSGLEPDKNGGYQWVIDSSGIPEASRLPNLVKPLSNLLMKTMQLPLDIWRPALYTLFAIFASAVIALRQRDPRYLITAALVVFQSALLALVNNAQGMRYQYCVIVIGLFAVVMLFLPPRKE